MASAEQPSDVELLNRFSELVGLTPTQLRLWRRLWLEQGQPLDRAQLITDVWGYADTRLFNETMVQLRRKLRNRGWDIASHPGPGLGNVSYSLHPSSRPQTEGD